MLLSRFWYVFLALAAAAATAAALLSQAVINARADEALAETLQRDRTMIDAMLRLEARSRLDRLAFISVDSKLGGLLKQAQGVTDEKRLRELNNAVKEALHAHVLRMAEAAGSEEGSAGQRQKEVDPDIAFALDSDGRIIGQLGPMESNPAGASLVTFPLVKRALQGYVRDDVWIYDRRVYRVAARPVMSGTDYAGAIVHGYRLEKGLPEKASAYLGGATVGFFYGGDMLGSYVPGTAGAPPPGDLASALAPAQASKKLKAGECSDVMALAGGGRALFAPITGSAAVAGVGYAIARPRKLLSSPQQLFEQASADDVKALPMPLLGAGAILLALIGLLFVYLEHDQHMKELLGKTGQIAAGDRDRLVVSEWRGAYRTLADGINRAIDKEVEKAGERAPVARKKANLDEILGPTPEASGTPFFGFAGSETAAAPSPPAKAAAAQPKPQAAAPKLPLGTSPRQQPAAPSPAPLPVPLPPPAAPPALRAPSPAPVSKDDGATFDEDAHFREVYQEYVATRKQCGEPIDNLSFEKFGVTLRKTRDQIVEKQGVKLVRFSVQIKEGKAALKAQPFKR
jgi:hypothetical protein